MNPFFTQVLGGLARAVIVWVAAHFGQTVTDDQATKIFIEYIVPAAVMLWSVLQKYRSQKKLVTSIANPQAKTEKQVEDVVKAGGAPSVLTPKSAVPQ